MYLYKANPKPPAEALHLGNVVPVTPRTFFIGGVELPYPQWGVAMPNCAMVQIAFQVEAWPFFPLGDMSFAPGALIAELPCNLLTTNPWGAKSAASIVVSGNLQPASDPTGTVTFRSVVRGNVGDEGYLNFVFGEEQLYFPFTIAA